MYTAIVLDKESKQKLVKRFIHIIPNDFEIIAHHMTINMGPIAKGPITSDFLGQIVSLEVVSLAMNEKVIAVGVVTDIPSDNKNKHITLAVNRSAGGKPVMSNNLSTWEPIFDPFVLFGKIEEINN